LGAEGAPPLYSDLGYILAGEALARRCGVRDAGEAIEALVVKPLARERSLGTSRALRAAKLAFDDRVVPTEAVGWRGGVVRGAVHDENAWALTGDGASGHAGLFGTIDGVLAFATSALDAIARSEGPLSNPGGLRWMIRPRPGGDLRAGFDGKS